MILADKIITLRKKNGMSQEELAEMMNVSRQSVSKWESAQAVPDLNKIIMLSQIFGVSTDFLLKDELEEAECFQEDVTPKEEFAARRVSLEEANEFLHINEHIAAKTAFGVVLCILSPVVLLFLGAMSEDSRFAVSENVAAAVGLIVLLALVAGAVAIFLMGGAKLEKYKFMGEEILETAYGVAGMVKERKEGYADVHTRELIIGIIFCVLSAVPLFGVMMVTEEELIAVVGLELTLLLVAIGVFFIVKTSIIWGGYQKLLEEGDYTREKKMEEKKAGSIMLIYWMLITAAYLAYSFITNDWGRSWIIWPVAGVLSVPVREITKLFRRK